MKPNVFAFYDDCREDAFSRSLGYVLNTFPEIGQRFAERLAALSGNPPELFGDFVECDFVGQEFLLGHKASKPDLRIRCRDCSIFVEVKLDAPLSVSQMQRHLGLVERAGACRFVFISNIQHVEPELRGLRHYLRPANRDHFVWAELLPAFDVAYRRGSLSFSILADFKNALRAFGMVGRQLAGATDSLYTVDSNASHLALTQLANVMFELGYKLQRKQARELTLRAYPNTVRKHPLLNPRFLPTAADLDPAWNRDCLEISVWDKKKQTGTRNRIADFQGSSDLAFVDCPTVDRDLERLGVFLMPVGFHGSANASEIDFHRLRQPLTQLLQLFQKS